jgi:DMSO reductase family type II enzyme heme b subunit
MIKDIYPFPDFSPTVDTGNVMAEAPGPVHTLNAEGHGTLTARPLDSQRIDGDGRWRDGTYRVLVSTNIQPADSSREVDFTEPTVPVAFAIWDGNSGDRDGTKLVSQWLMLSTGTAPVAVSQRRPQ